MCIVCSTANFTDINGNHLTALPQHNLHHGLTTVSQLNIREDVCVCLKCGLFVLIVEFIRLATVNRFCVRDNIRVCLKCVLCVDC